MFFAPCASASLFTIIQSRISLLFYLSLIRAITASTYTPTMSRARATQTIQESAADSEHQRFMVICPNYETRRVYVHVDDDIDPESFISKDVRSFGALNRGTKDNEEFQSRLAGILNHCCTEVANRDFQIDVAQATGVFDSLHGRGPGGKGGCFSLLSPQNPREPTWTRATAKPVLSYYVDPEAQTIEAVASHPTPKGSEIHKSLGKHAALTRKKPGMSFLQDFSSDLRPAKLAKSSRAWNIITEHQEYKQDQRRLNDSWYTALKPDGSTVVCSRDEADKVQGFHADSAPTEARGPSDASVSHTSSIIQVPTASAALTNTADPTSSILRTLQEPHDFAQTRPDDLKVFMSGA